MKKSFVLFAVVLFACAALYAGPKEYVGDRNINLLQGYTTMEMDMVSYGNTVYEAFLGMNHTDLDKGTPIFINKYIDNRYSSTLQIDVEGFDNYEFSERFTHYDFLKLYALGPDEIILTVYSAFSDNRFAFFRIKDDRVVAYKSYSLKNQRAYETQYYAYDGKDTVYVGFNGQVNFKETGWDLFLLSFDLNGNLQDAVTVYTNQNDELVGLAAFEDNVYFEIRRTFERQAVVQLDGKLNFKKIWACKYYGSDIRYIYLKSGVTGDDDIFLVQTIMETKDADDSLDYLARFSADGNFISSYKVMERTSDNAYNYCKEKISDDGILYFGHRTLYDPDDWENKEVSCISYFMDWDGNKLYEKIYRQHGELEFKNFASVDGKYFCSGENYYEAEGIGHVAYTYLVDAEPEDTDFVHMEKSDYNPLTIPQDEEAKESYDIEMRYWNSSVKVEPIEVPAWDFGYTIKLIRLPLRHIKPLSKSITNSIPLFEFSER